MIGFSTHIMPQVGGCDYFLSISAKLSPGVVGISGAVVDHFDRRRGLAVQQALAVALHLVPVQARVARIDAVVVIAGGAHLRAGDPVEAGDLDQHRVGIARVLVRPALRQPAAVKPARRRVQLVQIGALGQRLELRNSHLVALIRVLSARNLLVPDAAAPLALHPAPRAVRPIEPGA